MAAIRTLAVLVPPLLVLAPWSSAQACSICLAGDPIFTTQGASAQAKGTVSVAIEVRSWRKTSGLLPHDDDDDHGGGGGGAEPHLAREVNESQRLDLYLAWTPIDRITITADLPWAFNKIIEKEHDERTASTHAGFGDLSLSASAVVWRDRSVLPTTWLEARAFLKAPSGESSKRVNGVKDPHLQVGTGSWDFGFGGAAAHRVEWGSFYGSAFYRVNTKGSLEYEYGDVALANAAVEVPLGHALGQPWLSRVTLGGEFNFRWAAHDRAEESLGPLLWGVVSPGGGTAVWPV